MKLARLRVRNFRCFQEEISIDFEDITALIGRNDSGKSTLMDALGLFLNDIDPDKDDASKGGNPRDLTIICEFTDLPDEVILEAQDPLKAAAKEAIKAKEAELTAITEYVRSEVQKIATNIIISSSLMNYCQRISIILV